jgi:hypothetical protein
VGYSRYARIAFNRATLTRMPRHLKIRPWQRIATLLAILAVLLLPHLPNHASALFLLVPIFFFIERIDHPVPYQPRKHHVIAPNHHVRSILFQRPPPSQA